MGDVVQFPNRKDEVTIERSEEAQARMEQVMEEFDAQFQLLFEALLSACDDFPTEYLTDPISWGNGYLQIVVGAGVDPERFLGFQQIQALCEEFGFIYEVTNLPDGTLYYEFTPNEEDEDE